MKVAIFSDIHGNLPAFELMLKDAGKVDLYISLGDVVNYGPWSNECVQLLDTLDNCVKVIGNHEEDFLSGRYRGEKKLVKTFFDFCIRDFTNFASLRLYIKDYNLGNYFLIHTIDNRYIFPDSQINLDKNYIIGHSHYQFSLRFNGFVLMNAGSVGQNREYINVINYLIYDTEKNRVYKKGFSYNIDLVIREMERKRYPKECLDYYRKKPRKG